MAGWLPSPCYRYARHAPPTTHAPVHVKLPVELTRPAAVRRARQTSAPRLAAAAAAFDPAWYREDHTSGEDLMQLLRMRRPDIGTSAPGCVYLVGTGPGDPGLLTLKAVRLMQSAHVVLYDRLVSEEILGLISPAALMVYVGKQRSYHTRTQPEIHELLRTFAAEAGATVVRLKGGDPFVFGRGGEEAEYLAARGVRVHVVPGITAASGIAAELGIPLTHRGLATSVRFLTGHAREGGQSDMDAAMTTACDDCTTLVVYMGLATLSSLVARLVRGGLPPDTPAVAVERGTTPEQRAVWAPLEELQREVDGAALVSPTLLVIGRVVALAPGWGAARAAGEALQAPGAHHLPLPVLPGVLLPSPRDLQQQEAVG